MRVETGYISARIVVCNSEEIVMVVGMARFTGHFSPKDAEAIAIHESLLFAKAHGLPNGCVQCDSSRVIYSLNSNDLFAPFVGLISSIVALLKEIGCDTCSFTLKNRNKVSHTLVSFATTIPVAY
ncbi:Ribonuclease H-like domain containing protein [Abeliophyllum distichum]|uniref:Ribonuclease H-like domain containing protein n=1 Tax=Abeliophyllum distichum TaxID=126358 RepID=A0ABD1TKN4_9LAMI